jgi:hypothetical protein
VAPANGAPLRVEAGLVTVARPFLIEIVIVMYL